MVSPELHLAAAAAVFREADCLDRWQWQDWLDMFTDDCEFWCPAWVDEETLGDDPDRYVSFFYLAGRAALGDRVFRVESGLTPFVTPLPRTCHVISNLHVTAPDATQLQVSSHWQTSTYHRRQTCLLYTSDAADE